MAHTEPHGESSLMDCSLRAALLGGGVHDREGDRF